MSNNALIKCGFSKDENNSQLLEVFRDGVKFKELYIDIYSASPFSKLVRPVLMLRHHEKNAIVSNDGLYVILKMNKKYNTHIAELLFDAINEGYFRKNSENSFDFILNCQNIFYKLTIFK